MLLSLELNADGDLTEELRQKFAPEVVVSFNAAQAAWNAYLQHLEGHGFLLKLAAKGNRRWLAKGSSNRAWPERRDRARRRKR